MPIASVKPSALVSNEQPFDFALLQQAPRKPMGLNRWGLFWLMCLLLLTVGSVVVLVLFLHTFETEEEERRGRADALVIQQATQFHFRRLEEHLMVLARHSVLRTTPAPSLQGGVLWRTTGVVLSHGWLAAGSGKAPHRMPARWLADRAAHPVNAELLDGMHDITRDLHRSNYAGPMRAADGSLTSVVWLAVPFFENGQFLGNYLAALSMADVAQVLPPDWFEAQQQVRLESANPWAGSHLAAVNLPGMDLFWEVSPRSGQPTTVPRIFFLVTLVFLLGMLVSLFALRRDVVKRQKVQSLLQAEVALRSAMESAVTIGLRAWDLEGKILYVNKAFCNMVGYAAADLVGKSAPLPYWPKNQVDELREVQRGVLVQGTQGEGVELQFQHLCGRLVDVLIHEAPLYGADGRQMGWMSSVLDISERKRAQRMAALQQEKLESSGRLVAVGEVASTLAHELNQPLGALSSFASGLANRLQNGNITLAELTPVVTRMVGLAERAGGIIQRVNAFARRREITLERVDIRAVLRRVLATFSEGSPHPLNLIDPEDPVWVHADELLLEHLINNLCSNALDWAGRGTACAQVCVQVECDVAHGMAVLVVSDSGPGVTPEQNMHIFNAFFSTKDGGMGMGLAICRSIVEAHHGRIEVGQDPRLGGARFTVCLPLGDL